MTSGPFHVRRILEARIGALEADDALRVLRRETLPDTEGFVRRLGFQVVRQEADGYGPALSPVELPRPLRHQELL